jgi:hypothetical protein
MKSDDSLKRFDLNPSANALDKVMDGFLNFDEDLQSVFVSKAINSRNAF